mmetsp:Transcript_22874/g.46561  ORF Transcript_22874/g.46561 Transcript_22874/m.46561 type:complete len:89 (-) Transcript_22874:1041-1307(-)
MFGDGFFFDSFSNLLHYDTNIVSIGVHHFENFLRFGFTVFGDEPTRTFGHNEGGEVDDARREDGTECKHEAPRNALVDTREEEARDEA